jgi:hypothetical protein
MADPPSKRKDTTSPEAHKRWRSKNLKQFSFSVRRGDPLLEALEAYEDNIGCLIRRLLRSHFGLPPKE